MRVLFSVSDWSSHYFPMVPLGWALQAAGHELRVACDASQAPAVARAGLTPVPLLAGRDPIFMHRMYNLEQVHLGRWPHDRLPPHPVTGEPLTDLAEFGDLGTYLARTRAEVAAALQRNMDDAVGWACDWRPALVVCDLTSLHGLLAAAVADVPCAVHLWGPVGTAEPPEYDLVPDDRAGTLGRFGVTAAVADLIEHVIDPCPADLAPPTAAVRLPGRYVPYNGGGPVPAWTARPVRASDRPRVCVVFGDSLREVAGAGSLDLPGLVRSVARLDVEVVVLVNPDDAAKLGDLPDNVRIPGPVPLHALLPTCAAVIHHGGAGSLMTALAAGVPQLSLPFFPEQRANAARLAATGAGDTLDGRSFDPAGARARLVGLLGDPRYRRRAAALRDQLAGRPSPAQLVERLEELARAGRRTHHVSRRAAPIGQLQWSSTPS
jgi:UDP:flavonoid glycosyltransferase YjiC (YdhE family)